MSLGSLLRTVAHPIGSGAAGVLFFGACAAGIFRWGGPENREIYGAGLAAISGLLWFLGSLFPIWFPGRGEFAGAVANAMAASCAAGAALYLTSDDAFVRLVG